MSLHRSLAFSREQMRKEPPIFLWSEYVSSGGGVRRCLSITGMRLWIRSVVDWAPNSNSSMEAKASPRIITASTWAFIIAWTRGRGKTCRTFGLSKTHHVYDPNRRNCWRNWSDGFCSCWFYSDRFCSCPQFLSTLGYQKTYYHGLWCKGHRQTETFTLDSNPVRNFMSIDFWRTPSRLPSAAEWIIYNSNRLSVFLSVWHVSMTYFGCWSRSMRISPRCRHLWNSDRTLAWRQSPTATPTAIKRSWS